MLKMKNAIEIANLAHLWKLQQCDCNFFCSFKPFIFVSMVIIIKIMVEINLLVSIIEIDNSYDVYTSRTANSSELNYSTIYSLLIKTLVLQKVIIEIDYILFRFNIIESLTLQYVLFQNSSKDYILIILFTVFDQKSNLTLCSYKKTSKFDATVS